MKASATASLVDIDNRRLLFWGGGDVCWEAGLRRHFMPMLSERGPGWSVQWAHHGILDLAADLGLDPHLLDTLDFEFLSLDLAQDPGDWGPPLPARCGWFCLVILTLLAPGSPVRDYSFVTDLEHVLAVGPDLLEGLRSRTPVATLPQESHIQDGAVIDVGSKRITAWWGQPVGHRLIGRLSERWPGWEFVRQTEGFPLQLSVSGRPDSPLLLQEGEARERLEAILASDTNFDPMSLVEYIARTNPGAKIEVDPPCPDQQATSDRDREQEPDLM